MTGVRVEDPEGLDELVPLHARPPIRAYLSQVWDRREFIIRVPRADLRARHMNNVLGILWYLLNPLMLVGVYYLFFGLLIGTDRGVDNFIVFLAAGVFTFSFLQRSMTASSRTVTTNIGLIRAIRFPRAVLPLSEMVGQILSYLPVLFVLLVIATLTGEAPSLRWLMLAPLLVIHALLGLAVGFILARLTTAVRDVQSVLPFLFRLTFYMSGVLYSVDAFVEDQGLRNLFSLNPFFDHIELVRWAVLGLPVSGWSLLGGLLWPVVLLPIGFAFFRRGEPYGGA